MARVLGRLAALAIVWEALGPRCAGHEGPPYPIAVDRRAGASIVSVWADPDVGTGTFFVILEPAAGTALPAEHRVQVCVRPVSGRLPEACHPAARQQMRDRVQYFAEVPFDRQELWRVRVAVAGDGGGGEVTAVVEVTPPGLGRWDLAFYLFPFVLLGLLWLYGALRGARRPPTAGANPPRPGAGEPAAPMPTPPGPGGPTAGGVA